MSLLNANNQLQVSQNIQVAVRCRPLNDRERKQNSSCVIECNEKRREVVAFDRGALVPNNKTFTFDRVFGMNSKQCDVYNQVVRPVVKEVIEGYNCTIFAYGQTGTGKTFTMEGERSPNATEECAWEDDPMVGIIPRAVAQLFNTLKAMSNCEYSVKVSFIELYNEELSDLLSDVTIEKNLRIYEDPNRKGSVTIPGLEEVLVKSKGEVYAVLQRGADRRKKAETLLNSNSSRSHSIFTITVCIKEKSLDADSLKGGEETLKIGKLNLVDLAGSENIERSGATGKRATEAGKINKSLTTLGRVITSLVEHRDHIPYRESNLTRLLQDSLGGRTKTTIVATISPAQCNLEETLSTLDYAHKAKSIRNKPEINQKVQKAVIKEYTEENDRLKRELWAAREKNGVHLPLDVYQEMQISAERQKEEIRELTIKVQTMTDESLKTNETLENTKQMLDEKVEALIQSERVLGEVRLRLVHTEVERDENKFLLDEHVSTEKQLYAQAQTVLQSYDSAQSDNRTLHEKLNEIRNVMHTNRDLVRSYASQTIDGMGNMDKDERECHASNELMIEQLKESVQRGKHIVADLIDVRLRPQLHQFEQKQAEWMSTLASLIAKEVQSKELESTKELTERLDAIMQQRTSTHKIVDNQLMARRQHQTWLCESMHDIHEQQRSHLGEFEKRFDDLRGDYLTHTVASVSHLADAAEASLIAHSNSSANIRDKLDNLERKQHEERARMERNYATISSIISQLANMHTESEAHARAINADLEVEIAEMKALVAASANKASDEAHAMSAHKHELIESIEKVHDELVFEPVKQLLQAHQGYLQDAVSIVKKLNENYESTDAFILEKNQESLQFEEEKSKELSELASNQQQHVTNICEQLQVGIEVNKKEIVDTLAELADETVMRDKVAFEHQVASSLQISDQMRGALEQRSSECIEFLSNGIQCAEDLEHNFMCEAATGRTPPKRNSTSMVEFAKTRAHGELLDAFRRRNQLEPLAQQPSSPGSSGSGSSLSAPLSKRAAYGSTNDLENMVVDTPDENIKPTVSVAQSEKLVAGPKNPMLPKNLSSRGLFTSNTNNSKKVLAAPILRDRNN